MSYNNNDANEHTFSWGEHKRIVSRPPERNRSDRPTADPTQNDDVERWECLDCGLDTQAARGLGVQFSSRSCPPFDGKTRAELRPTKNRDATAADTPDKISPSQLPDDLGAFARDIAEGHDVSAERIAAECHRLTEKYKVPHDEAKPSIRRAVEQGEYDG